MTAVLVRVEEAATLMGDLHEHYHYHKNWPIVDFSGSLERYSDSGSLSISAVKKEKNGIGPNHIIDFLNIEMTVILMIKINF